MLDQYFKDINLLEHDFMVIPAEEMQVAESIYKKFFNRRKLLVVQWRSLNNKYELSHFFDNVQPHVIDSLINDEEYHICFQSDVEGWNQVQWYVPLCASAAGYGIPFSKLVFSTANLDVKHQYETYSKRSGFEPPIKIIGYDHFLVSSARWLEEVSVDPGAEIKYTLNDPEKYFDEMYQTKLKNDPNNIFLHLSRVCRDHRIFFNYLADNSKYRKYYHLSQDKIHQNHVENLSIHTNIANVAYAKWCKKLPLIVDTNNFRINYGTYHPRFIKLFSNYLVNIAGETNWNNNLFYSEKTYKPIITMMPFLVYGTQGMNKELTTLGFKLYDNLFDYSWENEFNGVERIKKLFAECENFATRLDKYSHKERVDIVILKEKDTIIHNFETLLKYVLFTNLPLITINL